MTLPLRPLLLLLAFTPEVYAGELVELQPGRFGRYLELIDAFLAAEFGVGYTGDPLARTDAYLGFSGDRTFLLVRHDSVCDGSGCPLLVFEGRAVKKPLAQTRVHYRIVGRAAVARYGTELLWLYSEPADTDATSGSGFPTEEALRACCGDVYTRPKLDLADVYVGAADLNDDGRDEVLVYVEDPSGCEGWYPGCESAILQWGGEPYPGTPVYRTSDGMWTDLGEALYTPLPCPADRACRAVMVLDSASGGFRTILSATELVRWTGRGYSSFWLGTHQRFAR